MNKEKIEYFLGKFEEIMKKRSVGTNADIVISNFLKTLPGLSAEEQKLLSKAIKKKYYNDSTVLCTCENCDSVVNDSDKFCHNCGSQFDSVFDDVFSLINVTSEKNGRVSGYWLQDVTGTMKEAKKVAKELEKLNSNKIKVAIVEAVASNTPALEFFQNLKRLDSTVKIKELEELTKKGVMYETDSGLGGIYIISFVKKEGDYYIYKNENKSGDFYGSIYKFTAGQVLEEVRIYKK